MKCRRREFTLSQALERAETRKKLASMRDDLERAQRQRSLRDELDRVEGVLYHRLRPGQAEHVLHAQHAHKLREALARDMFDLVRP